MRFSAMSNGMKYPMQSQINSNNRLNGFVLRFNCLIFNILYATTLTQVISNFRQSVPIRVLSIRSDPGFVNPFRSVPIRVLLMPQIPNKVGTQFDDKNPLIPTKATKSTPNAFIVREGELGFTLTGA
jgi:hypothetical protein